MHEPYVRPDVRAYLDGLAAHPRPVFTAEVLAAIRGMVITADMTGDRPVGELAEIRDVIMPGPGGDLPLRLFDARVDREPGPVVVFYHGGGFAVGSIETHAGLAAEIARQIDVPVVSVDYRLAPEHPWPAAPEDAEAAARWIARNSTRFGRQFTGLVLCGDSAGGNLTIVTALALRDRPAALPVVLQIPIYPAVDRIGTYPSRSLFAQGYGLDAADTALFDQHYAADPAHHSRSPLLVGQQGMPATVIVTAGLDPLRDEGRAYAAATILAGVPTAYHEAQGTIHGFATFRQAIPSAQHDLEIVLGLAKTMLGDR